MKFEIRETVKNPDPEVVLRALEMCSREISDDVTRFDDRIMVRGLGPSPRSKNKNDNTVFRVNAENGETVIVGEVNFQASALLGDASQEDVVRSKLEDLFEQMKAQIDLDALRVATYAAARKSAAGTAVVDRSEEPDVDPLRASKRSEEKVASSVAPETLIEAMTAAPDLGWGAAALVAEPQAENIPPNAKDEPERVVASEEIFESEQSADAEQTVAPEQRTQPRFYGEPDLPEPKLPEEEPTWQARTAPYRIRIEDDLTSGWKRFALWTTMLLALLAVSAEGYFYWSHGDFYWPHGEFYWPHREIAASPAPVAAPTVGVAPNPAPKLDKRKASEAAPAKPASLPDSTPESATNSAELKLWLQNWAASMRTRDANAQAAFYAETLDRYLNQRNVGREAVLRDREATNRMRKGLWTVKMEDVVIERQTESEAEVRLVKHFMDEQETSEILESFVPTRLTLKRMNGEWKITSEQDQPSLQVTPWKN
jgi:ketosteroid isomerase-like protein